MLVKDPIDYDDIRWRLRYKQYIVDKLDKLVADLKLLKKMKPYAAVNFIRKGIGFDDYVSWYCGERNIDQSEIEELMEELSEMVYNMESYGELFEFIAEYGDILKNSNKVCREKRGLNLMTMHGSKGLEFDVVYIIDFVEGIVPYKKAKTAEELEEERRMMYVAMTRAKHELYIYSPMHKGSKDCTISRFSKGLKNYICNS